MRKDENLSSAAGSRHLPQCRDATRRDALSPLLGTHFPLMTTTRTRTTATTTAGGESFPFEAQVFPVPRFVENALRDALLNIRLTSRRLLGILIDKFYPGRASYSKLRSLAAVKFHGERIAPVCLTRRYECRMRSIV